MAGTDVTSSPTQSRSRLTGWLERAPAPVFILFAVVASFSTYFAMYAFRRPFSVAKFEGENVLGTEVALKTAIVISQILGYALSKYLGIKFCSEIKPHRRAAALLILVGIAEGALFLYGLAPGPWKVIPIFLNGLPLGMIWGLVVWYLEGRRSSEILLAGLSLAFIVASGIVKDFGRALLDGVVAEAWRVVPLVGPSIANALGKVSEGWMPAIAGLHFTPVFLISVWMLTQLPRPSAQDVAERVGREPMKGADRLAFIRQFALGLSLLCIAYFFLTAYRDFRDNYQVEIFDGLGYPYKTNKSIITQTEMIVMVGVMVVLALLNLVKDNRRGLMTAFGIMTFGTALLGVSTAMLEAGWISGFWWMICTGLGSYLAYVPYGSVLFDRLIASTRVVGTAVFAIYLADAIGYTGSVMVQLFKDLAAGGQSRFLFFKGFTWFMSGLGIVCLLGSCLYFWREVQRAHRPGTTPPQPRE